jgi:hypothetical protein
VSSYFRHSWKIAGDGYIVLSIRSEQPLPADVYQRIGAVNEACEALAAELGWYETIGGTP